MCLDGTWWDEWGKPPVVIHEISRNHCLTDFCLYLHIICCVRCLVCHFQSINSLVLSPTQKWRLMGVQVVCFSKPIFSLCCEDLVIQNKYRMALFCQAWSTSKLPIRFRSSIRSHALFKGTGIGRSLHTGLFCILVLHGCRMIIPGFVISW